jgi:c-di-GMP-binding flagellar brake protein YcgR
MVNELLQVQRPGDPTPGNYRSRIEDIVEEKLVVAWPSDGGLRLPVHPDQMLGFSLVRAGNAYYFSGLVDSATDTPLPLVTVIVSSAIQRVQRRQDFRIKCLIPIELVGALPNSPTSSPDASPAMLRLKTHTYDLSASGVAIRSETLIPDGTLPEVRLSLPDGGPAMKILCRVTHCSVVPENPNMYHAGIQFIDINEKEKARIVRFVYRTQLKGLRT